MKIVISGAQGEGKSTVAEVIRQFLIDYGHKVTVVCEGVAVKKHTVNMAGLKSATIVIEMTNDG